MTDPTGYAPTCVTNTNGSTTCTGNVIVTGTHIAQKVSATVSAKGGPVSFSGPLAGPGGHSVMLGDTMMSASIKMSGNDAQTTQGAADAQNKPTTHTDIGSLALVNNDGKGNVSLTDTGVLVAVAVALTVPAGTNNNETYKLVSANGNVTPLETSSDATRSHVTVNLNLIRNPVINVHGHENDPNGGVAQQARDWPGPGDQNIVKEDNIINVIYAPDGAVRVIELKNGVPSCANAIWW